MKYAQRDELVTGLRDLADFMESNGLELPELHVSISAGIRSYHPGTFVTRTNEQKKALMRRAAKAMSPCKKVHEGRSFYLKRKFGPINLSIITDREVVCQKIVVGTREVPEYIAPAHTEEIAEWVCSDPLLAATEGM